MRNILLIGAGRSSTSLISYLLEIALLNKWNISIVDRNISHLKYLEKNDFVNTIKFDVNDAEQRIPLIKSSDIVISMLPARMHLEVAKDCIEFKKNMVTASYISEEMKALDQSAREAGVILLNEIGVDPGIDHLSAKKVLDEIVAQGGKVEGFESFTGGLVAPESDDNPWNYKFTWNPRNVVVAGQGRSEERRVGKECRCRC